MVVARGTASMRRRRAVTGVIVASLMTAGLAGCQSRSDPVPLESESGSPVSSPSPSTSATTAAAPPLPAAAKGTSEAAAKAFVRHYIALINHAMKTGDTEPLHSASARQCTSCSAVVDRVNSVYSAGGSIVSDGWRIRSLSVVPLQPNKKPIVDVGLEMSQQVVKETADARPRHFDGGRLPTTFYLALRSQGWIVLDWERVS
jgi:hypothetical protein